MNMEETLSEGRQLCTFFVDGELYGLPIDQILEVLTDRPLTGVPLAPPTVAGLINLRGQIVVAVDMRRRLELTPRADDRQSMNVVVRHQDNVVSLLVDEIGDVISVAEDCFEEPPETLEGVVRNLIHGAYKLEDRLLLLLDAEEVLNLKEEGE
jgi:purine-binding chemotaxis protein CheW